MKPHAPILRRLSDERLATLAARGDEAAFGVIAERHAGALGRYCRSLVGNEHDAEDAMQNALVTAMGGLRAQTRATAVRPWLFRIAHHESISLLRARRADADLGEAEQIATGDDVQQRAETGDRLRGLAEDLRELTPKQRGSLLLRELGGLEFAEIGHVMGISAAAAKQSVHEARVALLKIEAGRSTACADIRRVLAAGDGRSARARSIRGHLRACEGCRRYAEAGHRLPRDLGALFPVLPVTAVLRGMLGAGGGSAGAGAGAGAGAAGLGTVGAKAVVTVVVGGALAAGTPMAARAVGVTGHRASPAAASAGAGTGTGAAPARPRPAAAPAVATAAAPAPRAVPRSPAPGRPRPVAGPATRPPVAPGRHPDPAGGDAPQPPAVHAADRAPSRPAARRAGRRDAPAAAAARAPGRRRPPGRAGGPAGAPPVAAAPARRPGPAGAPPGAPAGPSPDAAGPRPAPAPRAPAPAQPPDTGAPTPPAAPPAPPRSGGPTR